MATHPKKAVPKTPLQAFEQAPLSEIIGMLLWKNRIQNPELAVMVTEQDLKAYRDCMAYLKVTPEVKIVGRPKYVAIVLVEKDTGSEGNPGNAIKPVENNETDYATSQAAQLLRRTKETAPNLATTIRNQALGGEFSADLVIQAADALQMLCQA